MERTLRCASQVLYLLTLLVLSFSVALFLYDSTTQRPMFLKSTNVIYHQYILETEKANVFVGKVYLNSNGENDEENRLQQYKSVADKMINVNKGHEEYVSHIELGFKMKDPDPMRIKTLIGYIDNIMLSKISIAICMAITSHGANGKNNKLQPRLMESMPCFKELLPSFCRTATVGYSYSFYFAYDFDDPFFNKTDNQELWNRTMQLAVKMNCPKDLRSIRITFLRCNHMGRPAWAQNDAVVRAYNEGHDFFYRINDDTIMRGTNWADIFINELRNMNPPFVGVVGPNHSGGKTAILTYDFTYRTHIDIFGFHYPRAFFSWYADNWITNVYGENRSRKVEKVLLKHTKSMKVRYNKHGSPDNLQQVLEQSKVFVEGYLQKLAKVSQKGNYT